MEKGAPHGELLGMFILDSFVKSHYYQRQYIYIRKVFFVNLYFRVYEDPRMNLAF